MKQSIGFVTFLIEDYDKAIEYFVNKLQFNLIEDTEIDDNKRWVIVSPKGGKGTSLLLAKASNAKQVQAIGNQTGGRVAFFLHTDNFDRDFSFMKKNGVKFLEEPRSEPYGKVAVFEDFYGNKWDLLELKK